MPICVSYRRMNEIIGALQVSPFIDPNLKNELIAMLFELKRCRKILAKKEKICDESPTA